jgi:hypothetical protein
MPYVTAPPAHPATSHGTGRTAGACLCIAMLCLISLAGGVAPTAAGAEAESLAPSSIEVSAEHDRLTVSAHEAPLDEVLQAVGAEAGVAIEIRGDLTSPVTSAFVDVPLEEAIRRLLRGHSYTLYADDGEGERRIEISVIATSYAPAATAAAAKAAPPGTVQDKLLRIRALSGRKDAVAIAELGRLAGSDPSAAVRSQAVAALGRLNVPDALPSLSQALTDQSPAVRIQALRGVKSVKGDAAISDLQAVVGYDSDPAVRRQAVRLLSDMQSPEVPLLLKQAAADSDAAVSRDATRAANRWQQRFGARYGAGAGPR